MKLITCTRYSNNKKIYIIAHNIGTYYEAQDGQSKIEIRAGEQHLVKESLDDITKMLLPIIDE